MIIGFKFYAITIYYYFELFGPLKTPNIPGFLAADGPYLLGLFFLFRDSCSIRIPLERLPRPVLNPRPTKEILSYSFISKVSSVR